MADATDAYADELTSYDRDAKKLLRSLAGAAAAAEAGGGRGGGGGGGGGGVAVTPNQFVTVGAGPAFAFHYLVDGGVVFLTLAEKAYPSRYVAKRGDGWSGWAARVGGRQGGGMAGCGTRWPRLSRRWSRAGAWTGGESGGVIPAKAAAPPAVWPQGGEVGGGRGAGNACARVSTAQGWLVGRCPAVTWPRRGSFSVSACMRARHSPPPLAVLGQGGGRRVGGCSVRVLDMGAQRQDGCAGFTDAMAI